MAAFIMHSTTLQEWCYNDWTVTQEGDQFFLETPQEKLPLTYNKVYNCHECDLHSGIWVRAYIHKLSIRMKL